ncbi:MAG: hypothetical protein KC621_18940 [Myxococcales bacterium]|nr:hypothetical protein [Myxococcales bacterium]
MRTSDSSDLASTGRSLFRRVGDLRNAEEDLRLQLAIAPLAISGFGVALGTLVSIVQALASDLPVSVPTMLGTIAASNLLCAFGAHRGFVLAPQVGTLVWLGGNLALLAPSPPAIGVPMTALAVALGVTFGTINGGARAWLWGPAASVGWLVALGSLELDPVARVGLSIYPPLMFVSLGVLLAQVGNRLRSAMHTADVTFAELLDTNERLARRTVDSEAANRAKSSFLAGMSHELRTPLNVIIGYGELVLEDRGATFEDVRPDVERIVDAGTHLLALVDDLLDMSRIEAGTLELDERSYGLDRLWEELHEAGNTLAAGSANQLHFEVADDLPTRVVLDPIKVRQVLVHPLGNALRYTRGGNVWFTASAIPGGLRVVVRDDGPGIAPDVMRHLFVPFAQGVARGLRHDGSGLGLALTHRLATAMGGTVDVVSRPGAGTTVAIELPLSLVRRPPPPSRTPPPVQ